MRINLGLQGIEFENSLIPFILPDLGKKLPDTVGHGNDAVRQLAHLVKRTDRQRYFPVRLAAEPGNGGVQFFDVPGKKPGEDKDTDDRGCCLLYTSTSPRDTR